MRTINRAELSNIHWRRSARKTSHSRIVKSILTHARKYGRISKRQDEVLMKAGVSAPIGTVVY